MNTEKTDNNIPLETQVKKTQFQADWQQLQAVYWIHVTSARLLFKNDLRNFTILALSEKRIKFLFGWTRQAKEFYQTALKEDEIILKFSENGIPKEDLERCLANLKTLERNKLWRSTKSEYRISKQIQNFK
ncbi:MAG: hypothetical protein GY950_07945 [bacterium]|nr:hypothetical protein [bacterium]